MDKKAENGEKNTKDKKEGRMDKLADEIASLKNKLEDQKEDFVVLQRTFSTLNTKFNVLHEIWRLFTHITDLDAVADELMDTVVKVMDVDAGSFLLVDEEKSELYFKVAKGEKAEQIMKYRLPLGENGGLAGWVATQHESVAISDVKKDPRFRKDISQAVGYEVRSMLCVPIKYKGKVFGVYELLNKRENDVFTNDDKELLEAIADATGMFIEAHRKLSTRTEKIKAGIRKVKEKLSKEESSGDSSEEKP